MIWSSLEEEEEEEKEQEYHEANCNSAALMNKKDDDNNDNNDNLTMTVISNNGPSSSSTMMSSKKQNYNFTKSKMFPRRTVVWRRSHHSTSSDDPSSACHISSSCLLKVSILLSFILFEYNAFTSLHLPSLNDGSGGIRSNAVGTSKQQFVQTTTSSSSIPVVKETQTHDTTSMKLLPPLVFGVGQGTTGTHSMFLATCHLNITSVHGIETCLYGQNHSDVAPEMIDGFKAHALSVKYYKKLRHCANSDASCNFDQTTKYVEKLKYFIREVIMSPIGALHDTPYTFMTPYVIQEATKIRGIPPILLHSERDPIKWSSRRAQRHPIAIVCKYFFDDEASSNVLQQQLGAFDLDQCIQMARTFKTQGVSVTKFDDVFASYRQLTQRAGTNNVTKLDYITQSNKVAIEQYQLAMRQQYKPLYIIDMFERAKTSSLSSTNNNNENDSQENNEQDSDNDADESEGGGFVDALTIATELDELLWNNELVTKEQQDRLRQAHVMLMNEPVPHRKGRYSRMHPFLKGLIKCNGTHPIVG